MANEHDGLVVTGDIPKEAVEQAAKDSNMEVPELVEKDMVSNKDFWGKVVFKYQAKTNPPSYK